MQPFPPPGDPVPPVVGPTPSRSSNGALVALAAAITFILVIVVAIVIVTQLGRPTVPDDTAGGPAFVTKPTSTTSPPSTASPTTTEPTTTTPPTAPPTSPSTTTLAAGLADALGEDVTAGQLRVPAKPAAKGQFAFLNETGGQPVSFDACRPIHYVVRVGAGPTNGLALVSEAVRRLSAATGLRFQYDGPTSTVPQWEEPSQSHGVADVGSAFTPVFIGWATPKETDIWAHAGKDVLGVGGPEMLSLAGGSGRLYVTGHAVLLPDSEVAPTFGPGVTEGNILLHELGHVVGLDHVTETGEVMVPDLTPQNPDGYGPGDLQGLYALGSSRGCASSYLLQSQGGTGT